MTTTAEEMMRLVETVDDSTDRVLAHVARVQETAAPHPGEIAVTDQDRHVRVADFLNLLLGSRGRRGHLQTAIEKK